MNRRLLLLPSMALFFACSAEHPVDNHMLATNLPSPASIDQEVQRIMQSTGAQGLALAVIDAGEVSYVRAYGYRNTDKAALETSTIMYGASLTKMAFAYTVLQLVDEGLVNLDASIKDYLPEPLPAYTDPDIENRYARWSDLADDMRWEMLTPRILLTHSSGFANFGFLEPDGKLRFHFDPGSRYSYSGDGLILLQFVLEQGLGLDVGLEMQARLFQPLGMTDTSLIWRDDYTGRTADGWTIDGNPEPHDDRSRVRAAGSMDTSIADMARLMAAIIKGDLLSASAREAFSTAQIPINSISQFPVLQQDATEDQRIPELAAGLGVVVASGPQGPVFFKGGHNESTGNTTVCIETSQRCVVILGNDLRAEASIPGLVEFILGPTGVPWHWEYGYLQLIQ